MSRIPIRLRLTLAFAIAMAIVLAATGAFVYFRVSAALDEAVNESLDNRLADARVLAERGISGPPRLEEEAFTEITSPSETLLSPAELQEARTRTHPPPALESALRHILALSQLKLVEMAHPL